MPAIQRLNLAELPEFKPGSGKYSVDALIEHLRKEVDGTRGLVYRKGPIGHAPTNLMKAAKALAEEEGYTLVQQPLQKPDAESNRLWAWAILPPRTGGQS